MAQTTQEPLGKAEQMLVDMIDGEPIVETPDNKIQGLLMELADVIAQGGGGGGGGGVTKYAQLPDKPRINDVELSGNKSFSQLGLNIQNTPVNGSNDPISSGGVYNALADKVTKETGKSLTSNDFTNALLAKLNAIESGAQVNLIEKILVNGVEVAPSNKAIALTVMTNTVENLVNYYKKSETYSQAEVDQLISQISGGITLEVVEELPETGISTSTIYLIEAGENVYTQYLYSSVDEEWKILGSTTVDLSNYYTKTQVDTLLADKQDTLEYDNAPTASSEKMVKSGGVYNALQGKQDTLEYDNTPTEDSQKMVKSGAIWEALEGKQDTLEWDTVPTAESTKSLTSGAIKTALDGLDAAGKADKVEGATDGDLAALDENGNLTDSGKKASDFASAVNLDTLNHIVAGIYEGKQDKITVSNDTSALSDSTIITGVSTVGENPTAIQGHALSKFWAYITEKLTGAVSTIKTSNLTPNRVLISDDSGKVAVSSITTILLGYLSGLTGNIQTQLTALGVGILKYSTSETDTGMTWIDGKKIYRRVFQVYSNGAVAPGVTHLGDNLYSGAGPTGVAKLIHTELISERTTGYVDNNTSTSVQAVYNISNNRLYFLGQGETKNTWVIYEYTKA